MHSLKREREEKDQKQGQRKPARNHARNGWGGGNWQIIFQMNCIHLYAYQVYSAKDDIQKWKLYDTYWYYVPIGLLKKKNRISFRVAF